MEYKDDKGKIIPPSTMVKVIDLKENNHKLDKLFYLGLIGFIYLIIMTIYIIINNVLGNILRAIGC